MQTELKINTVCGPWQGSWATTEQLRPRTVDFCRQPHRACMCSVLESNAGPAQEYLASRTSEKNAASEYHRNAQAAGTNRRRDSSVLLFSDLGVWTSRGLQGGWEDFKRDWSPKAVLPMSLLLRACKLPNWHSCIQNTKTKAPSTRYNHRACAYERSRVRKHKEALSSSPH